MILNIIKYIAIAAALFFPFAVNRSLAFPLVTSHVFFIFTVIEVSVLLLLLYGIEKGQISFKKSYITLALIAYIIVLFISGIAGPEFGYAFWSSYLRSTGIVTWLHYFAFFFVLSSVFTERSDWKNIFRALSVSGFSLAVFSFLGVNGVGLDSLAFMSKGGSFLGNTSYSGAYLLLIFFFSVIGLSIELAKKWRAVYLVSMLTIFFHPDLFNFGIWNGTVPLKEISNNPMLLFGIARTSSIILWCGALLCGFLFLIHKLKNKKAVAITAFVTLLLISSVYLYGFASIMSGQGRMHDFYIKQSGEARPIVWNMAVQGIKERPILGYGGGNFKYVYQNNLDTRIIHIENPPWFDRAHNFVLDELVGNGIVGAVAMLVSFGLVLFVSFRFYVREKRFYFLLIPFIFLLHFLQLQTFFQIDSSLLLIFLLLAFLVSHQEGSHIKIPWPKNALMYQVAVVALMVTVFMFSVVDPLKENKLMPTIKTTKARAERLALQKKLYNLNVDPVETLRQISIKFMDETVLNAQALEKAGFTKNVGEEYKVYIDLYEKYLPRYSGSYRYLFEHANLINAAFIFGVNELPHGEEVARQSLEISKSYPYPYWVLAINLYYQGKTEESLMYAKQAYDLDPTIQKSKEIYDTLQMRAKSKDKQQSFFYLPGF